MALETTASSHPVLSRTDAVAGSSTDAFLLIGRVLLGWLFFCSAFGFGGKLWNIAGFQAYLTNLKAPAPAIVSWIGALVEGLIGVCLILGLATRYAALLCALFLIAATALAHRYWEYPAAQIQAQYVNFLKNLALFGAALMVFATGGGRFSLDRWLAKQR